MRMSGKRERAVRYNECIMAMLNTIKTGLLLSTAPAVITTIYEYCKNNGLDMLLFLVPALLFAFLASIAVSYFAARQFIMKMYEKSVYPALVCFALVVIVIIPIIVQIFIQFKVNNAYVLLPISIAIIGAVVFVGMTKIFKLR